MAKITHPELKNQCARIAGYIKGKRNLNQLDVATIAVRTILTELGCTEHLGNDDDSKKSRAELAVGLSILFTAPKNFQTSYMADKENAGSDGVLLMDKVEGSKEEKMAEFV